MKTPLLPSLFQLCAAAALAALAAPILQADDAPAEGKVGQPAEIKTDMPAESPVAAPAEVKLAAPAAVKAEAPAGVKVETIAVPEGQPDATVRDAIVRTAMYRQWVVISQKEGEVVLKMIHRKCEANLTLRIVGSEIAIYSDSYQINRNGARIGPMQVNDGWIKNLRRGIVAILMPAASATK